MRLDQLRVTHPLVADLETRAGDLNASEPCEETVDRRDIAVVVRKVADLVNPRQFAAERAAAFKDFSSSWLTGFMRHGQRVGASTGLGRRGRRTSDLTTGIQPVAKSDVYEVRFRDRARDPALSLDGPALEAILSAGDEQRGSSG
jgi:hypothetical protein